MWVEDDAEVTRDALSILESVKVLLATEDRFVTEEYAVDGEDVPVSPTSDAAQRWCLLGALKHVCPQYHLRHNRVLRDKHPLYVTSLKGLLEAAEVSDSSDLENRVDKFGYLYSMDILNQAIASLQADLP